MTGNIHFKNLNNNEKPRERLINYGPNNLTDQEILALIIRTGTKNQSSIDIAREILNKHSSLKNIMNLTINELILSHKIGIAKASSILAGCEIARRIINNQDLNITIKTPEDAYKFIKNTLFGKQKEHLYLLCLNHKNKIISKNLLTIGTENQALVSERQIYHIALKNNSHSIILVHNHPSNDPTPSTEDINITKKIAKIGQKIGIPLLDHIIFCDNSFKSLKALNLFSSY